MQESGLPRHSVVVLIYGASVLGVRGWTILVCDNEPKHICSDNLENQNWGNKRKARIMDIWVAERTWSKRWPRYLGGRSNGCTKYSRERVVPVLVGLFFMLETESVWPSENTSAAGLYGISNHFSLNVPKADLNSVLPCGDMTDNDLHCAESCPCTPQHNPTKPLCVLLLVRVHSSPHCCLEKQGP